VEAFVDASIANEVPKTDLDGPAVNAEFPNADVVAANTFGVAVRLPNAEVGAACDECCAWPKAEPELNAEVEEPKADGAAPLVVPKGEEDEG
jgi:hypothetical protein